MGKMTAKGTSFERMVADYLAAELGQPVDRRVKCGSKDKGDIAGLSIAGFPCVVECKNRARMELAQWLDEAESERVNAEATFGVVAHKRRGCGEKSFGGTYVTMTLDTLCDIARQAQR